MADEQPPLTYRNFAVLSILSRDAFGYTAAGAIFLFILQARFDLLGLLLHERTLELPGEIMALLAALAVSYPLGRVVFEVGHRFVERRQWCPMDPLYSREYRELAGDLPLAEVRPWGVQPTAENARTLWGRTADRWVFMRRPDLFYAAVTRPNTLRILAETMLGLTLLGGTILAVGELPRIFEDGAAARVLAVLVVMFLLGALLKMQIVHTRREQVRAEMSAGFVVAAEDPPVIAPQPPARGDLGGVHVLAWGSLLWRPGDLPLITGWELSGPELPIEFSRITRDGRLTLVIDRRHGVPVRTWVARLESATNEEAAAALAARERCDPSDIGRIDLIGGVRHGGRHDEGMIWTIERWMKATGHTRVIWTALPSTFQEQRGEPFSVEAALEYLANLSGDARSLAFEYIQRAPPSTMTPLREEFGQRFG